MGHSTGGIYVLEKKLKTDTREFSYALLERGAACRCCRGRFEQRHGGVGGLNSADIDVDAVLTMQEQNPQKILDSFIHRFYNACCFIVDAARGTKGLSF